MRRKLMGLTVAAVVMFATIGLRAQTKPNFAGKWTLVPDKTQIGGNGGCPGAGRGFGPEFTAAQTAARLTIQRMQGGTPATLVYNLDGSESKNKAGARQGGGDAISKASWNANKLAINTTSVIDTGGGDVPMVTMKTTHVLSLDPSGLLTIATTVTCNGSAPGTTTTVYKKGM